MSAALRAAAIHVLLLLLVLPLLLQRQPASPANTPWFCT
jgi:hypothetical protein